MFPQLVLNAAENGAAAAACQTEIPKEKYNLDPTDAGDPVNMATHKALWNLKSTNQPGFLQREIHNPQGDERKAWRLARHHTNT